MMVLKQFLLSICLVFFSLGIYAQTPQLLADVVKGDKGSRVHGLTPVANNLFFVADDDKHGMELWVNDPLSQSTRLVKDICEGTCGSLPNQLCAGNGVLYFTAYESDKGTELWKSDGTEKGTIRVKDINHGKTNYSPKQLTYSDGLLYFLANDGIHGVEVWKSDGTEQGTQMIKDVVVGNNRQEPQYIKAVDGGLLYVVSENKQQKVYFTDGKSQSVQCIYTCADVFDMAYNASNKVLMCLVEQVASKNTIEAVALKLRGELLRTTILNQPKANKSNTGLVLFDQQFYAYVEDVLHQLPIQLEETSNKIKSTVVTLNFAKGHVIKSCFASGTDLYLNLENSAGKQQVWRLNNKKQNQFFCEGHITQVVSDQLILIQSGGFLQSFDSKNIQSLTCDHTNVLADAVSEIGHINDQYYAVYKHPLNGQELFKFNKLGNGHELMLYRNINQKGLSFAPQLLTPFYDDLLCFYQTETDIHLLRYSKAYKTFYQVSTVYTSTDELSVNDLQLDYAYLYQNKLYFTVINEQNKSMDFWVSDGSSSASGTIKLKQFVYAQSLANDQQLMGYKQKVFFNANDGHSGQELWCTDGTIKGTQLFKDISPGQGSSSPQWMTVFNDELYFVADNYNNGNEVWKTNGEQTVMHMDVYNGAHSSDPVNLMVFQDALYFVADDGLHGLELWRSKGNRESCLRCSDIFIGEEGAQIDILGAASNFVYLSATDGKSGRELWAYDINRAQCQLVKDIHAGKEDADIAFANTINNTFFFFANDGIHGIEPWSSQGTEKSTKLIKDIQKGPVSSFPKNPVLSRSGIYFVANAMTNQPELFLYTSNGNLSSIQGAYSSSNELPPSQLIINNDRLYFVVDQYDLGSEIWYIDLP